MKKLLLLLIILSACTPSNPSYSDQDFMKGTQGIEFNLVENRPSKEIYEASVVPIFLNVHNLGAYHTQNSSSVMVVSVNTDPFYAIFEPQENEFVVPYQALRLSLLADLYGKGALYPLGESRNYYVGSLKTANIQGQLESPESSLTVNLCYPYKTTFIRDTCVTSDVLDTDDRLKACQIAPISSPEGQGAPINVLKVTPSAVLVDEGIINKADSSGRVVPTRVQTVAPLFEIEISNTGGGIPYVVTKKHPNVLEFCSLKTIDFQQEANKVIFKAFLDPTSENRNQLDCNGGFPSSIPNVITLVDGKAKVYCQMPEDNPFITAQYNYLANLRVEMDYMYVKSQNFDFEVIRKPGYIHQGSGISYGGEETNIIDPEDFLDKARKAAEDELGDRADDYISDLRNKTGIFP